MKRRRKHWQKFPSLKTRVMQPKLKPPEPWTLREKLSVWGTIALVMVLSLSPFLDQYIKLHNLINRRVEVWRGEYHLSDRQAQEVREIELNYYPYGELMFGNTSHSVEEDEQHYREIASHLNPEDAERFLAKRCGRR